MAKRDSDKGIPDAASLAPEVEDKKPPVDEMVQAEIELRRYIKRGGINKDTGKEIPKGFCKGLPEKDKKRAKALMKKLGREKLEWDEDLVPVPEI